MNIDEYIKKNWINTVRTKGKLPGSLNLPHPYTSPCAQGLFDDLYYWDTYFINLALLEENFDSMALNNILDMAYLIKQYGFMPNSANEGMLNRTQVPLFICMCDAYFKKHPDRTLKEKLFPIMEQEYLFWMNHRMLPCGLNAYQSHATKEFYEFFAREYKMRVDLKKCSISDEEIGKNALAECESGWDFSLRFAFRCPSFAPIDLNSILYYSEGVLDLLSKELNLYRTYDRAQLKRKKLMEKYMFDKHLMNDYDSVNHCVSTIKSCAMFFPYYFHLLDSNENIDLLYQALMQENGLSCCEYKEGQQRYQWGYPNMWPNLVYISFIGLLNVKEYDKAKQVGTKYLNAVENEFKINGKLWEKYDAITGLKATNNEYTETEMMGWTAASYVLIKKECIKYGFI